MLFRRAFYAGEISIVLVMITQRCFVPILGGWRFLGLILIRPFFVSVLSNDVLVCIRPGLASFN